MLPLLRIAADGGDHSMREAIEQLAAQCRLTDDEQRELLPSGQQPRFANRAHWARTYLKQGRLLDSQAVRLVAYGAGPRSGAANNRTGGVTATATNHKRLSKLLSPGVRLVV